jgi:hypothetical protein
MSKFLLNLLVQISKALVYSKIKFYSEIIFFLRFRPNRPSPEQPRPLRPQAAVRALSPLGLSSLGVFAKGRLFFEFAQSVNGVSSHVTANGAPPVRSTPFLASVDLKHASPRTSPQLIALRLPASIIATPIKAPYSPALIPPLESPLTPPSAINGVGRKSPAVTHRHFHPEHPRPPIKGEHPPPSFTAPLLASFPLSPRLSSVLTEHRHRRTFTAVARPPRCSPTSGEALDRTPMSSSCFPSGRGELPWTGAPVGRAPVSSSGRRRRPVHGGPESRWSTARGPSSRVF